MSCPPLQRALRRKPACGPDIDRIFPNFCAPSPSLWVFSLHEIFSFSDRRRENKEVIFFLLLFKSLDWIRNERMFGRIGLIRLICLSCFFFFFFTAHTTDMFFFPLPPVPDLCYCVLACVFMHSRAASNIPNEALH